MDIEGYIYFSGYNYDDNGHTDDYDLMFESIDGKKQMQLNDFYDAIFPKHDKILGSGKAWMLPVSVYDKIRSKLTITFEDTRKWACIKRNICEMDCSDKLPHDKESSCDVECDWGGKCEPINEPLEKDEV